MQKFNDAVRIIGEAEKIAKKLQKTDPTGATRLIKELAELSKEINKSKAEYDKLHAKPFLQKVIPDTPVKVAVWATIFAAIAGTAAYVILKKK